MRLALILFAAATLPVAARHVARELVTAVRELPGAELRQVARQVRLDPAVRRELAALRPTRLRPGQVFAVVTTTVDDSCPTRLALRLSGLRRD